MDDLSLLEPDGAHPGSTARSAAVLLAPRALGASDALSSRVARMRARGWRVAVVSVAQDAAGDVEVLGTLGRVRPVVAPTGPCFVLGLGAAMGVHARMAACVGGSAWAGAVSFGGRIVYGALDAQHPIQPLDLLPGLACPLLCHVAEGSETPRHHVDELCRRLDRLHVSSLVYRYAEGVDFAAEGVDADRAWARSLTFLEHLASAAA